MSPFLVLNDFGVLRHFCGFCRDNERVFLSHTCVQTRKVVKAWIPSMSRFKTLTRPKVLPELFDEKNGVFSIDSPKPGCDFYFKLFMLGHSDIHDRGIRVLDWFQCVTGRNLLINSRKELLLKFLLDKDEASLSARQTSILRTRLEEGRDELMYVHDIRHWAIVRDMFAKNSSIDHLILHSPKHSNQVNCYEDVFFCLSKREIKTTYLDLQGDLSVRTLMAFPRVAFDLTSLTLRRLTPGTTSVLLATILTRPNEANLDTLQLDSTSLDKHTESVLLDVLDTFPIKKLMFTETSLATRGFTRVVSVVGNSHLETLQFRRCTLGVCEVVQSLFLPTVSDSSLTELVLEGIHIPENVSSALASCVESSNFLSVFSVKSCRLGPVCMKKLVAGLRTSSLSTLNLADNYIGEEAHNLFLNLGKNGTLRYLCLDSCSLCSHSLQQFRWAKSVYRAHDTKLNVSVHKCKLFVGHSCSERKV